jgi:D-alanyl-D-alanine endopeptidase (penicillin-binding protein 7)
VIRWLIILACLFALQPTHATEIHSEAYIVKNLTDNVVLSERNTTEVLTPASITKLMTVLVVLESGARLDEALVVPKTDDTSARIRPGMVFTRAELIQLALVASDNKAAHTLGHYDPDFVSKMNAKARELGMVNTHFIEPTGRNYGNVTTAEDLLLLLQAVRSHLSYQEAASTVKFSLYQRIKKKVLTIIGRNTNPMAGDKRIMIAKTGFTNAAHFCIASIVRDGDKEYAIILLGSPNKKTRLADFRNALTIIGEREWNNKSISATGADSKTS